VAVRWPDGFRVVAVVPFRRGAARARPSAGLVL